MSVGEVNLHNNHSLDSNRAAAVVSSICEQVRADNPLCAPFFGNFWPPLGHFLGRRVGDFGLCGAQGGRVFLCCVSGAAGMVVQLYNLSSWENIKSFKKVESAGITLQGGPLLRLSDTGSRFCVGALKFC